MNTTIKNLFETAFRTDREPASSRCIFLINAHMASIFIVCSSFTTGRINLQTNTLSCRLSSHKIQDYICTGVYMHKIKSLPVSLKVNSFCQLRSHPYHCSL